MRAPNKRELAQILRIKLEQIPVHVACVMDGNGRWAKKRNLERIEGHKAGEKALLDTIYGALDIDLAWLTVYAFSTENWSRPPEEVKFLMNFNEGILLRHRDELNSLGVKIQFIGRRNSPVPNRILEAIEETEELTKQNKKLTLTIAFNYGGRSEIVDAIKLASRQGKIEDINEESFKSFLYCPEMPDPDLVIRTSNEFRISNFLLYELAYAELYFSKKLWPDFRRGDLFKAVLDFQRRERRFGKI